MIVMDLRKILKQIIKKSWTIFRKFYSVAQKVMKRKIILINLISINYNCLNLKKEKEEEPIVPMEISLTGTSKLSELERQASLVSGESGNFTPNEYDPNNQSIY